MKKKHLFLICFIIPIQEALSQNLPLQSKPIVDIFTDFHYNINDTSNTTGFALSRAYFGYNFLPEGNFSGTIIINAGTPEELAPGVVHRKYAYFKEASISWSKDKILMSFGITNTRSTSFQQKFYGKRYIANTFQSLNGYSCPSDLGLVIDYTINDFIKADFTVMNGEGYSEIQLDNSVKPSLGLTIAPCDKTVIRLYSDLDRPMGYVWQFTMIGFLGFKNELITIGAEASRKSNLDRVSGHNSWGLSGTAAVRIFKKTEIFGRYDYLTSVTMPAESLPWNYETDGQLAIFGFQYTFNQYAQFALDYQGTNPYYSGGMKSDAIYLNAHFKF